MQRDAAYKMFSQVPGVQLMPQEQRMLGLLTSNITENLVLNAYLSVSLANFV